MICSKGKCLGFRIQHTAEPMPVIEVYTASALEATIGALIQQGMDWEELMIGLFEYEAPDE